MELFQCSYQHCFGKKDFKHKNFVHSITFVEALNQSLGYHLYHLQTLKHMQIWFCKRIPLDVLVVSTPCDVAIIISGGIDAVSLLSDLSSIYSTKTIVKNITDRIVKCIYSAYISWNFCIVFSHQHNPFT